MNRLLSLLVMVLVGCGQHDLPTTPKQVFPQPEMALQDGGEDATVLPDMQEADQPEQDMRPQELSPECQERLDRECARLQGEIPPDLWFYLCKGAGKYRFRCQ